MEWIVGILVVVVIVALIWVVTFVGALQSRIKKWQDRLVDSLDQELLPIRQALNLIEPWETLMTNLNIDEETAKIISSKGFDLKIIAKTDLATFIANCGLDSVPRAKTIYETAVRITNPEKDKEAE
ncbi:MAG: hypothetical protein WC650_01720 [Candidatus Doudnabacteria bacterium]